jgi:5-methylcytosine-specific restriction endonuclease McrA
MARNKKEDLAVYEIDNGVCQLCGSPQVDYPHHIIYKSHGGKNDRRNMILLCRRCHTKVHTNEKYYVEYLLDLQRSKYGTIEINDLKKKNKWEVANEKI